MSTEQLSSDAVAGKRKNGDEITGATTAKQTKVEAVRKYVVNENEMRKFIAGCAHTAIHIKRPVDLISNEKSGAYQLADLLIEADKRGHYSHGVNRLDNYLNELKSGVNPGIPDVPDEAFPKIIKQKGGTALVDGDNCLGAVVGNFCADQAIRIARENGVAWICARGSNHFGICAHYALKIAKAGFIGMSFTNASPIMFLTGAAEKSLGSNPLCLVANGVKDNFELDMATSNVAYGKVELAKHKGKPEIPKHWAVDKNGCAVTNAIVATDNGGLLPLGGMAGYEPPSPKPESSSSSAAKGTSDDAKAGKGGATPKDCSYKGTGLAMMVEIFTAILSGANFGKSVRKWRNFSKEADLVGLELGQCFVALDPDCFEPNFNERLQEFIDEVHNLKQTDADVPVLVPGDPERKHLELVEKAGGIIYEQTTIEKMRKIGDEYGVNLFDFIGYSELPTRQETSSEEAEK